MSWPDARSLRWTPTQRITADDGTAIAVETLGDGHPGPTVVFLHGWTLSSRLWHYQRALAERWRLVLVDHRGHGESDAGPREHRTIDQLGRDLHAVITATSPDRPVVLVGHSMGGMTILALAADHPELFGAQVKGVAFVASSPGGQPANSYGLPGPLARIWNERFAATLAQMRDDPVAAERLRRSGSRLSLRINRWINFGPGADRRLVAFSEAMTGACPAQVMGDFAPSLETHDKLHALAALRTTNTLIIAGQRDRLLPASHSRAFAAALPDARLLELRGAGHFVAIEQPNEVNAALSQLITSTILASELITS